MAVGDLLAMTKEDRRCSCISQSFPRGCLAVFVVSKDVAYLAEFAGERVHFTPFKPRFVKDRKVVPFM
jgi:hypothetical protein